MFQILHSLRKNLWVQIHLEKCDEYRIDQKYYQEKLDVQFKNQGFDNNPEESYIIFHLLHPATQLLG